VISAGEAREVRELVMGFSFRLLSGVVSGAEVWMQLFGFPLGITYGVQVKFLNEINKVEKREPSSI
jgi:hypothetical protein